ncbi:MAG: hypothetical protein JST00_42370 [Deltaproteobacteria bacterium]|nr:hypothetical protein [Deltaproteobacteria bacterium]
MTAGNDGEEAPRAPRTSSVPPRRPSQPPPGTPSQFPPRLSQPPATPDPLEGLGRVVFAGVWLLVQAVLILTAGRSPDGAFGFRMFPESSTIKVALYREVRSPDGVLTRIHVDEGMWAARDSYGVPHTFSWRERVRRRELTIFDTEISAAYGVKAQLGRFQSALDDVSRHIPDDEETQRLSLDVTVRHNGHEPFVTTLHGPLREHADPPKAGRVETPPKEPR